MQHFIILARNPSNLCKEDISLAARSAPTSTITATTACGYRSGARDRRPHPLREGCGHRTDL
eukprot:6182564-Pyramimonas_sp.AAC.1